jgi:plasmid stabilization system protein ParE
MTYSFHPKAELELNQAIDYYEECQAGLGLEFADEVYKAVQRILVFPDAWQSLGVGNRRCLTNRFPFGLIYYQKEQEIIILAVMQLGKKPNYWKSRG